MRSIFVSKRKFPEMSKTYTAPAAVGLLLALGSFAPANAIQDAGLALVQSALIIQVAPSSSQPRHASRDTGTAPEPSAVRLRSCDAEQMEREDGDIVNGVVVDLAAEDRLRAEIAAEEAETGEPHVYTVEEMLMLDMCVN